jgi:hypothetical protein
MSAQNFQILPKNHVAKSAFYKHFTHQAIVLQPFANKAELIDAFQKENLAIEKYSIFSPLFVSHLGYVHIFCYFSK